MQFVHIASLLSAVFLCACGDEHDHLYKQADEVVLWMNTVGPFHNRQETYPFFSLPFCKGGKTSIGHYHETLGESLQGVELEFSGLDIRYQVDKPQEKFCEITLTQERYDSLVYAVRNQYWYQMYIDGLPLWGVVGNVNSDSSSKVEEYYIWTHKKISVGYKDGQIVDLNLTNEAKTKLVKDSVISFTYQVDWRPSSVSFQKRYDKYLDPSFFQHRIHWFSIFNSFMMVLFLVGLVSMILMRTLRKDYARYSHDEELDDMDRDLGDDYGWKQIHGDVFRAPTYPMLFASLIGSGVQLCTVSLLVILVAIYGDLYTERSSILSAAIFLYAVTAPLNGLFGGSFYSQYGGKAWKQQFLFGAAIMPSLVCGSTFVINFVAWYYHASRAIPFTSMLAVSALCFFVILPLTMVGAIFGRNIAGQANYPCRINTVPRPIPDKKWFMEPVFFVLISGVLPFGSIFIEMYFIFTSFWAYKIYYVYGFMFLVFSILIVVIVCVTIVSTYFLLNSEDYRWHWTSFLSASSTALYVYIYAFYYFFFKTKMYGFFQTSFYFSNMLVFSIAFGILTGTVGHLGTAAFVRKIYSTVKID